jgi:hypothetical protein
MELKEAYMIEFDLLNAVWWLYCNEKIGSSKVQSYVEDLDLELDFITLDGYKFISKDKKTTYSYDRKQKKNS